MGEIRKDNLHESLIEELNELANIDLSGKQDKTDESLLTESKDVIGAINELFQSANNGKELIADAIGEPLDSNDTFSAMSNDINGLLSTFKTNMMNNGITVESGDKFKQLIDKIATMAEEGSGKGIQFASGNVTSTSSTTKYAINSTNLTNGYTIEVNNLTFKPYIVILTYGSVTLKKINACAIHIDDATNRYLLSTDSVGSSTNTWGQYTLTPVYTGNKAHTIAGMRDNGFLLYSGLQSTEFTYYAIGVGEEDNTFRDSLASILQEEGVSVTEEDDMASLISKVDEEFDRQVVPAGNAAVSNVLTGKTFINSTGNTLTGTMANNGTKTITPKASAQTLGAGYYDKITINGDSDLVAANIVSGKNIFGVAGSAIVAKKYTSSTTNCIAYMFAYNSNTIYYTCVADGVLNIKCVYQRTDISSSSIETTNMQTDTMYTFNVTAGEKINFKCRTSNSYSRIYIYANIS